MRNILKEINLDNWTNYKIEVLKKHKDNEQLKRLLKMTYDSVSYVYGISPKSIEVNNVTWTKYNLEDILDILENEFATRKVTWNTAKERLKELYENTSEDNKDILYKIIDRDLKINIGKRGINKVFWKLIVRPLYMRCGVFSTDKEIDWKIKKGTSRNISYPAILQLKADWTYREVTVENGKVEFISRSWETYKYSFLEKAFSTLPNGKYIGELTVEWITNRAEGNGLINSDNPPEEKLKIELWDYITLEEYSSVANKEKGVTKYEDRLEQLINILNNEETSKNIALIETVEVNNVKEALLKVSEWMSQGLEGGILKDKGLIFKDSTSKYQLKLKLEIDADVRITGFTEGKKGTSREKTFWAITFETDDGKVKGQTSGFTEAQLKDYNNRREELIGKVMAVQFNDITKGSKNDFHALSHPRFIEIRNDKTETDTLERIKELKVMAMELK